MALPVLQRATTQFSCYPKARRRPFWRSVCMCAGVFALLGACKAPDPNERVTGSGGTAVKYSSRQVSVDLTDSERTALAAMRDRGFPGATREKALTAVASALKSSGYAPVTVETDTALVEAGRSEVLVPKWREVLRGVLKTRIGMLPAKPDHQYTAALVSVRPAESGQGVVVRARFDNTVWDSNGDARTKTVLAREEYEAFFGKVGEALNGALAPRQP
ncbi:hypothetical protein [Paraburkholderia agricolaris]|uniref:hypothetical protein n=1 Tax=Paraburkholderia agricolaris TaxID=2152888 RepID=UPI001FE75845|nr:hypothetical protein [Paraburkholderia agricolaris]